MTVNAALHCGKGSILRHTSSSDNISSRSTRSDCAPPRRAASIPFGAASISRHAKGSRFLVALGKELSMDVDQQFSHIGVVLHLDGNFFVGVRAKPLSELTWELPRLLRQPGETLDDVMRRTPSEFGLDQKLTSWCVLGVVDDVSADGFPRRSQIALAHLSGQRAWPRAASNGVWRSLAAGPPHLATLDHLLRQALPADPALLAGASADLASHIAADHAVAENRLEGRDPRWLRLHADAAADRAALAASLGTQMCFSPRTGSNDDAGADRG
jgi:hypothetical protein